MATWKLKRRPLLTLNIQVHFSVLRNGNNGGPSRVLLFSSWFALSQKDGQEKKKAKQSPSGGVSQRHVG